MLFTLVTDEEIPLPLAHYKRPLPGQTEDTQVLFCSSSLSLSLPWVSFVPAQATASPILITCAHGCLARAGLRNSIHLCTCTSRRGDQAFGGRLPAQLLYDTSATSASTTVLHCYVCFLYFTLSASSTSTTPTCRLEEASTEDEPTVGLGARTTTPMEPTTPKKHHLGPERSLGM
jgi:hypothetical protein